MRSQEHPFGVLLFFALFAVTGVPFFMTISRKTLKKYRFYSK
jgi:hypothetical protein